MKATKIISACAVLVALASCSNDHVISQPGAADTPIRIQANVGAVTTKAASDIQGSQFVNGESVNVYIYENTTNAGSSSGKNYGTNGLVKCTADGSGNLNPGSIFYPQNGNGIDVYGVYPISVTEKSSQFDFSVQTNQSEDTDYKASDLMYASCETNHTKGTPVLLTFKHKLSKVTVELVNGNGFQPADLEGAEIKIMNTYNGCTITKLDKTGIGTITCNSSSAQSAIKVGTWSSSSSNKLSAIVIPQTVNKGNVLFEVKLAGTTNPYKYTIPSDGSDVTFAESNEYKYKLTIKIDGIDVKSDITPWTDATGGTPIGGDATLQ